MTRPEDHEEQLHWRALSDPTRRRILDHLRTGPRTTGELAAEFPISRVAVMKHLGVLADAGLVLNRKRGRQRWHYVNLTPLMRLHERWSTPIGADLAEGLLAVKDLVEGTKMAEITTIDLQFETVMAASARVVYEAVTTDPGAWWGPPYVRAEATALSLEARVGGRLVEEWHRGGQVLATVTGLTADEWIQLRGPFHLGNASATVEFAILADGSGSVVRLGFSAYGLIDPATAESFGLAWQVLVGERLKAFVEHGTRAGIDPS